jgi:hypothetical protein
MNCLTSLIEKVKQKEGLLHLYCKKLRILSIPLQNINMILEMLQLNSVQDLEVNCTWKLSALENFAPYLGWMGDLRRLLLSHTCTSPNISLEKEKQCVRQFSSQFLNLHHIQELRLDSISFLEGCLHHMLR